MIRNLSGLQKKEYDLIVIGGGIFGVCAAWDAASRGLSTALVEKEDFSHATSANHLKMVHGGIRYLQHGDIVRIRESCRERSALLRIAPHLVRPLPVIVPVYGTGMKGMGVLGAGIRLYDFLTMDRNEGIDDPKRKIPRGRLLSRRDVLDAFPGLQGNGLRGGALFYDGQVYNPPRLALSFLRAAVEAGSEVANYLEVVRFLRRGQRVTGVEVRDILGGETFDVRGKMVLNAAGPWAARLLETDAELGMPSPPVFSRDVCFVVRESLSADYALACQTRSRDADAWISRGGRHLFLAPWRGHTLVGVWHGVHRGSPDAFTVTDEELRSFLAETNDAYPGRTLSFDDITMVNSGLILFADNEGGPDRISFGKRSILWDHRRRNGVEGLVTLIGVRATTARGMAGKAVDLVFRKMGKTPPASRTENTPLFGGRIDSIDDFLERSVRQRPDFIEESVMRSLVQNHGSECGKVIGRIKENPAWAERLGQSLVLRVEVVHAVREEMALRLGDVVFRRTDLGTGEHPGEDALRECGELMGAELGWGERRILDELEETRRMFPGRRGSNSPDRDVAGNRETSRSARTPR